MCFPIATALAPGLTTVQVITSLGSSNTMSFTVTGQPTITGVSPASGPAGTQITITGTNFGPTQYSTSYVVYRYGPPHLNIVSWSDTQIVATIPAGTSQGEGAISVSNNGLFAADSSGFTVQSSAFVATTGTMNSARYSGTATELQNGTVLLTGGVGSSGVLNTAELYTPSSQSFASLNAMNASRWLHTATLLNNGQVLIVGGYDSQAQATTNTAEIYDPVAGTFTLLPNTLNTARAGHTATLLNNGQVIFA